MKLTPKQRGLAASNIKFAYHQAHFWKQRLPQYDWDEVFSACQFGLVKAARSFDDTRGLKFTTLCTESIKNEVLRMLRAQRTKKRKGTPLYLYEIMPGSDEITYLDTLSTEDTYPLENSSYLKELFGVLTDTEQEVVRMYFYNEIKQEDIANVYGFSQTHISRIIQRSIDKMRKCGERLEQIY
jgi:RNA polymerase sporulation-specific sigma factor